MTNKKVPSHKKLISILELFLGDNGELSLSEMSNRLKLNKSTINRIASFLVEEKYLKQQGKRGKYSLGTKFLQFNYVIKSRMKIRNIAVSCMEKLTRTVQESSALVLWDGQNAIVADSVDHESVLRASASRTSVVSLYATAPGKVILANLEEEERKKLFDSGKLGEPTESISIKSDDLEKQLKLIKEQGFALEMDEYVIGISSVAVAIKDSKGKILGAISVMGPTARLPYQKLMAIVPDVRECVLEVSRWLE